MKFFVALCLMMAGSVLLWAQNSALPEKTDNVLLNRLQLTQLLNEQLDTQIEQEGVSEGSVSSKSISKAVLLSAAVPGVGQFYAKSFFKGALFFATEVTAWTINIIYNNRGDDKTRIHRSFVDAHWSEQRYWSYVYYKLKDKEELNLPNYELDTSNPDKPLIINWQDAEVVLDQYDDTQYLRGFTHQLPATKTQQYYEMVGKYPTQFGNAWDDASFQHQYNGYTGDFTLHNARAEDLRAELNHMYNIAGYGSMIVLVNHLISAIDAGFTTRSYNRRQLRLTYQRPKLNGERVNMFGLRMDW